MMRIRYVEAVLSLTPSLFLSLSLSPLPSSQHFVRFFIQAKARSSQNLLVGLSHQLIAVKVSTGA